MESRKKEMRKSHVRMLMDSFSLVHFPEEEDYVIFDAKVLSKEIKEKARLLEIQNQQKSGQQELDQASNQYVALLGDSRFLQKQDNLLEEFEDLKNRADKERDQSSLPIFQFADNYKTALTKEEWYVLLETKNFNFRSDPYLLEKMRVSVYQGLSSQSPSARQSAWLLLLGIDLDSQEFQNYESLYLEISGLNSKDDITQSQLPVASQIVKDVHRTFANTQAFQQDPFSGSNKLYNILKVYSIINADTKYVQGMNFIAALILMTIKEEAVAFMVFTRLLEKDKWKKLYLPDTPKLFVLADKLGEFMKRHSSRLYKNLDKSEIFLESLFASPFMTLFANLVSMEDANRVLDRFILDGEEAVLDIMKSMILNKMKHLERLDSWDLQVYIGRKMYEECIRDGTFFPPYKAKNL